MRQKRSPIHRTPETLQRIEASLLPPIPPSSDEDDSPPASNTDGGLNATVGDEIHLQYQVDDKGIGQLPDGTVVVEPRPVEEPNSEQENSSSRKASPQKAGNTNITPSKRSSRGPTVSSPGVMDLVKCTRCSEKVDPYNNTVHVHPVLKVLLCKRCFQLYTNKVDFEKDPTDNKDSQCRWCTGYGDLFCCDVCDNSFCRRCIKRNIGRSAVSQLHNLGHDDTWQCFVCDPKPLQTLREECQKVIDRVISFKTMQAQRKRTEKRTSEKTPQRPGPQAISSNFLPPLSLASSREVVTIRDSDSEEESPTKVISPVKSTPPVQLPSQSPQEYKRHLSCPGPQPAKVQIMASPQAQVSKGPVTAVPSNPEDVSLRQCFQWLDDPCVLNGVSLDRFLDTSLRTVALFYQDLRRLQMSLQQDFSSLKREHHLTMFRSTYRINVKDRLLKLPLKVNGESSSSANQPPARGMNGHALQTPKPRASVPSKSASQAALSTQATITTQAAPTSQAAALTQAIMKNSPNTSTRFSFSSCSPTPTSVMKTSMAFRAPPPPQISSATTPLNCMQPVTTGANRASMTIDLTDDDDESAKSRHTLLAANKTTPRMNAAAMAAKLSSSYRSLMPVPQKSYQANGPPPPVSMATMAMIPVAMAQQALPPPPTGIYVQPFYQPRTPEITHVSSVIEDDEPSSPGNASDNSIDLGVATITEENL